ncbi:MAG: hypothetical protein ABH887_01390 [bacterium]
MNNSEYLTWSIARINPIKNKGIICLKRGVPIKKDIIVGVEITFCEFGKEIVFHCYQGTPMFKDIDLHSLRVGDTLSIKQKGATFPLDVHMTKEIYHLMEV